MWRILPYQAERWLTYRDSVSCFAAVAYVVARMFHSSAYDAESELWEEYAAAGEAVERAVNANTYAMFADGSSLCTAQDATFPAAGCSHHVV